MLALILCASIALLPNADVAAAIAYAAFAVDASEPTPAQTEKPAPEPEKPKPAPQPELTVLRPRVQCLIICEPHCPPCAELKAKLQKELVADVAARGQQPWDVSARGHAHFRICTFVEAKLVVGPRMQLREAVPQVCWVVDGKAWVTDVRDPIALAKEFHTHLSAPHRFPRR